MVLKISKLTNPITYTVKCYAKKRHPLQDEHSLKNYLGKEKGGKAEIFENVCNLATDKKSIVDKWEMRLFTIGCIQGTVMVSVVIIGCYSRDFAKSLTKKRVIVIGPYMKISLGLLSVIEMTRLATKFIAAYHKKQQSDNQLQIE